MQPSSTGVSLIAAPAVAGFGSVVDRLKTPLSQVEQAMHGQVSSPSELVGLLGDHVIASGGKRLRPALVLLAAELCGYTGPRRVHMAAALELLHTATLLHDDVVDLSELRRGQPSANALWGNRRAVLGGDFLLSRSASMIIEDGDADILYIFGHTLRGMSEGELMQLERSFDPTITEAHYYAVIERKSAVLVEAAAEIGSVLAGVTRAERRRVSDFGRELGVAFQLRDDALDYEDRESELGKRPFDDLREGKVTLPLLLALKRCTHAERGAVAALLKTAARNELAEESAREELEITPALEVIQRYRGVEDTIRRAHEHASRAAEAIAPFPDGSAKQGLLAAARYAVERAY